MNFNMSVSSSSSSSHNGVVTSQSSMSSSVAGGSGGMSGSMAMNSSGGGGGMGMGMGMLPGMGMPTMPMMPGAGAAAGMNASMHGMQAGMGAAMGGALAIAGIMGELASALVTVVPFVKPHDGSYIGVQTDKAAYSAGETLQGYVVLQNNSPRQIDSVVVVVSAVERTRWDEEVAVQRSSGEGENRKTWTEYNHHHHTGEITHLKERVEVSRLAVMLGAGSYSYPFKYALRSDLPGCVRYNKSEKADDPAWRRPLETFCEVVYTVEAYVDTHGMFDKDLSSKQELVVNSAFNWAAMKPQVGAQHGQVLFCCCVPRGQVSLTAAFDRAAYMAGETAQIKAGITNDSEQDVKKMGVRLLRRIVLRANDGNKKVIEDVMCKQNYPGVEKHSAAVRDLPLPLLSGAGNLQPGTRGQLVEIGYTFRVACDMFCAPDIEVNLPMTVFAQPPTSYGLAALGLAPPSGMRFEFATLGPPQQASLPVAAAAAAAALTLATVAHGGAMVTMSPLAAAPPAQAWTRHSDGKDVWFVSSTGETSWTLPPGATVVN